MMKLKAILVFVYVVILGQFLYSNFVQVIGPNYTIHTTAYNKDLNKFCPPDNSGKPHCGDLNCSLANSYNFNTGTIDYGNVPSSPDPRYKGFPFATNDFIYSCTSYTAYSSKDFNVARVLNGVYIVAITGLFGFVIQKTRGTKRQS